MSEYKTRIESLTLIPSSGGRFEITIDSELVFSKLNSGRFPDNDEIKRLIRERF